MNSKYFFMKKNNKLEIFIEIDITKPKLLKF